MGWARLILKRTRTGKMRQKLRQIIAELIGVEPYEITVENLDAIISLARIVVSKNKGERTGKQAKHRDTGFF